MININFNLSAVVFIHYKLLPKKFLPIFALEKKTFEPMSVKRLVIWLCTCIISLSPGIASTKTTPGESGVMRSSGKVSLQVFFRSNGHDIDPTFSSNQENIQRFLTTLDSLTSTCKARIDSVVLITSSASPEGTARRNAALSRRRAAAMEAFFRSHSTSDARMRVITVGEDWQTLRGLLLSSSLTGRGRAVEILDNTPLWVIRKGKIVGSRKKAMMDYRGGKLWREMDKHIFPLLRQATLTVHYSTCDSSAMPVEAPREEERALPLPPPVTPVEAPVTPPAGNSATGRKPLLAIKTNLLLDAATVVNLGIEIPLGERYSVSGEFCFPWWRDSDRDITVQMLGGTVEGRYWLGDRAGKSPLTGFYAGVYGGGGYFDFQLGRLSDGDGVQGDSYITGGISAGYAHTIGRSMRMEYTLGVGFLTCDYRKYVSVKETKYGDIKVTEYPWEEKRFSGFLPTKASVSLVWLLNTKRGGGR